VLKNRKKKGAIYTMARYKKLKNPFAPVPILATPIMG
jgi:hypothetical protein